MEEGLVFLMKMNMANKDEGHKEGLNSLGEYGEVG
jgi:hypothetical protein